LRDEQNELLVSETREYLNGLVKNGYLSISSIASYTGYSRLSIALFLKGSIKWSDLVKEINKLKDVFNKIQREITV